MIQFGTGGWRAIIGDAFTKQNLQLLTSALAEIILAKHPTQAAVCIGFDRRFLSKESARWAAEAFAAKNVKCYLIDRAAPTPLIMYAVKALQLPFGIAITASHNPALYNGVKVFTAGGKDAQKDTTDEIEAMIDNICQQAVPTLDYDAALQAGLIAEINPLNDYIDSILSLVDVETIKRAALKIALDPMYGVSQTSLQTILMTARCDVLVIHDRHDTLFGGRLPAPNSETLNALSNFVVENHCNFGIATDGDADRLGVIDDRGTFLHPNKLLTLLYYYLLEYRGMRGPVVRNLSTTHLLDRIAQAYGQECHEVPVGFKYISSKMEETDAIIGGESSGGLTVRGHISGKDGIYAATLLTEMTARTEKSISALYQEVLDRFGEVFTCDEEIAFKPADREQLHRLIYVEKKLPQFPDAVQKISYADGCKVYFENGGWTIARFSGTEPLLRISAEMPSQTQANQAVAHFRAMIDSAQ